MPVGSTSQCSEQESGFTEICLLTPLRRLYPLPVRQASVLPSASSRFHLAMDTVAVRLTRPLAGCVEDFHLQVSAPCRAHKQKAPREPRRLNSKTPHQSLVVRAIPLQRRMIIVPIRRRGGPAQFRSTIFPVIQLAPVLDLRQPRLHLLKFRRIHL